MTVKDSPSTAPHSKLATMTMLALAPIPATVIGILMFFSMVDHRIDRGWATLQKATAERDELMRQVREETAAKLRELDAQ